MTEGKKASVLVCVTGQHDCDRLIRTGREIADEFGVQLQVLCVQPTVNGYGGNGEEIEYLHQTSKEVDAQMSIFFHDDAALVAAGFARQVHAAYLVTGMPDGRPNGFVEVIHQLVPDLPIAMVSSEGKIYHMYPAFRNLKRKSAVAFA